jgi:hypothetical protein
MVMALRNAQVSTLPVACKSFYTLYMPVFGFLSV